MVTYVEIRCPRCGAPLPPMAPSGVMHCSYCAAPLVPSPGGVRLQRTLDHDLPDPERPRLWLGGRRYVLLGRLGRGEGADVFFGRSDQRLSEQVVVEVLRARAEVERMAHQHAVLSALQRSTHQGAEHFTRLLPQPVAHGEARLGIHGDEGTRTASVLTHAPGFVHTFAEVHGAYPKGIDGAAATWLWKRILETLSWVHQSGWVHGALLPAHLLVHARDHGVRLLGWGRAVPSGRPLPAFTAGAEAFYPAPVWEGASATPATDLTMSARSILWLIGGGTIARSSAAVPDGVLALLLRAARDDAGGATDAWALRDALSHAAHAAFGPPKYVPFPMPGWRLGGA